MRSGGPSPTCVPLGRLRGYLRKAAPERGKVINCHRPRGPRSLPRFANDSLLSWRRPGRHLPRCTESAQNFPWLLGAPGAKGSAPGRLCLGRSMGGPAWKQGAGHPDLWSPDSISRAGSSRSESWMGRWTGNFWKGSSEGRTGSLGRPRRPGRPLRPAGPACPGRGAFLAGRFVWPAPRGSWDGRACQLPNPAVTSRWQSPCAREDAHSGRQLLNGAALGATRGPVPAPRVAALLLWLPAQFVFSRTY